MNNSPPGPAATTPALSVVVIALDGGAPLRRCLERLQAQLGSGQVEIIVPHDDRLGESESMRRSYPRVQFHHLHGKLSYAGLRTAGVARARGGIVAITEDQCIPPAQWCANILAAHRASPAAIGGPVEKQEPDTRLGWAIYLREFTAYIPPVQEGPSPSLTDCNVSYKREALNAVREIWADEFHEEDVHRSLEAQKETLLLHPGLVTRQQRTMPLGKALRERYRFGRLYGSLRVASASGGKRAVFIVASPLLPLLLTTRVIRTVLKKRRYLRPCLLALPYLLLFAAVWSWGELAGYLSGHPADSD